MDELARITQKILLGILTGDRNVSDIRASTGFHPRTVSIYLTRLVKQGLIKVETKSWKRGKSKPCYITDAGIKWLINIPLNENLQVILEIVSQLKNPKNQEIFRNIQKEKYSRNVKIIRNYFMERFLKGDKSPLEYPDGLDLTDQDQPFREALKRLLALHLYLISDPNVTPDEVERNIENDFILFAPHMRFVFSWHPGAFPELESELRKVESYFRSESEKLKSRGEDEIVPKKTHLLGLERVDEKYYDEYIRATDETSREKIMAKIEDEAGWSVGIYLRKLLIGRRKEITEYIDGLQRPSLRKFISLFENCRSE